MKRLIKLAALIMVTSCAGQGSKLLETEEKSGVSDQRNLSQIEGIIQREMPCMLDATVLENGCLRVVTKSGGLFYLNRNDRTPEGEFSLSERLYVEYFTIFTSTTDSIELQINQPVVIRGHIVANGAKDEFGGYIREIDAIELTEPREKIERQLNRIEGVIQRNAPCLYLVGVTNEKGCLFIMTPTGGRYFINRDDHTPDSEFDLVQEGLEERYMVWPTGLASVVMKKGQSVVIDGKIGHWGSSTADSGEILSIERIELK